MEEKFLRNTYIDEDDENAEYTWIFNERNLDEFNISENNNKIFKVSINNKGTIETVQIGLDYTE